MDFIFQIDTILGFSVRTTRDYWDKICLKHPELIDRLEEVKKVLKEPMEIRKSKTDELIFLFYMETGKYWLSVVAKKENDIGFLVTAYFTDKIKEGERVWPK
ncbi:MAG: hypothetical protein EBS19_12025 [Spirochaetia bacterium]|jgi:hypothetical protein|nr:hypothetical protein [Spirochaetia bacterium]